MSMKQWSTSLGAALMVCGATAVAQTPSSAANGKAAAPAITVTGCVQKESAVLERTMVPADTGTSDEFVLTNAAVTPASGRKGSKPEAQASSATTGTSGSRLGLVYRLTGDKESELAPYIGQRVSISGTLKAADKTRENTREVMIDSIGQAAGSCAPIVK
jgi:hypothetical protein